MNDERRNQHRDFSLSAYDDRWIDTFNDNAKILKAILGTEVVNIHHVGSTSIPGMLAKPQVDILIEVKNLDAIGKYYAEIEKAGFKPMGRQYTRRSDDEYIVKDSPDGSRLVSVHTYQVGNPEIENLLVFRDYLKENETARNTYINKKKELYEKFPHDYPSYRAGKFALIEELKRKAFEWRNKS